MTITTHGIAWTRGSRALWMLEECGVPYRHEKIAPAGDRTRTDAFWSPDLPQPQCDAGTCDQTLSGLKTPLECLVLALGRADGYLVGRVRYTFAERTVASVIWYLRTVPTELDTNPDVKALFAAAKARPAAQRTIALRDAGC